MLEHKTYARFDGALSVGGLPEGADALVFVKACRARGGRHVFIAADDTRAANFIAACQFFAPDITLLHLPAWDCLPYDRVSPSRTLAARRTATLYALTDDLGDIPLIIVTTISGAQQKVAPRNVMSRAGFRARAGEDIDRDELQNYLVSNGYSRASIAVEPGDFAVRGGLIDIFPPELDQPVRLDFFGDELESLRSFDPQTQRTTGKAPSLYLAPVSEALLSEQSKSLFRTGYIAAFGGGISRDPIYAAVTEGIRPAGIEHYMPLLYDGLETVFDYFGAKALIAMDGGASEALMERRTLIEDYYDARVSYAKTQSDKDGKYRALEPDKLYLSSAAWDAAVEPHDVRLHSGFERPAAPGIINFGAKLSRNFSAERQTEGVNIFEAAAQHLNALAKDGQQVWLASWTEGSSERMGTVLTDHDLRTGLAENGDQALGIKPGTIRRVILPLEHGFTLGGLSVISEQDILGDRLVNRGRRKKAKNFISDATALQNGDLVIHIDHGLGRYLGLTTLQVQNAPHDCLELEYAKGAKLFLPVENIELLSRYGSAPDTVLLDTLGSASWQARKSKAKQRLRDMAEELIKIAAKRALRTAEAVTPPEGAYDEFCARFPYSETDDQLSAIEDVIADLGSGRPMDRLICGDVGFGKTEVALRAAFIMAMSGKQVAIVAPTTVLARQHFKTFEARFRGWPVKVRQLSRLVTGKNAALTREALKTGQCDIVIGTHALLAKSVGFRDLGLLVVDEEQRFGVQHKERLKALRADVHVLTLTATPIPRTLQMALSGIRDLSLIATPPVDRLAVRTYITPWDPVSLREAILRERYRGGQSFFVVPRIADLKRTEEFLQLHVPEVKYVIAHGQISGGALEDVMTAFYDGQYDVLLSTSIIESGIDIPTANTMIIYRADRFGLAQLYQMRGRVGRSKTRAYAYMTLPDTHQVTAGAQQRLKVLQSLDTLGSGFSLASHDLDMRGGGNPLGEEQSGHIKDLGVELYQHMLEEAVAALRDDVEVSDQSWTPQVNLGISVLIPESYVEDLNVRLSLYRRTSEIEDDTGSESFAAELIDRFGPLPRDVENLLKIMQIKRLCRVAHVEKVDAGPKGAVLTVRHGDVKKPEVIINALQSQMNWKLRPDQSIFVRAHMDDERLRISGVIRALKLLMPPKD
ncbi:transcription-repair coupling factor [Robiginitomaculum antarcticum]|uniref:transcription-repair coupling factor n=1 Tax=Robiginitomaculum antarcticum TaxID=437507 RepID=UPI00038209BC|nr:transcription-repair coupling factor [Robiginitomaculum antarcticum]